MSSVGFSALKKKCSDKFLEANDVHPVRCDSPLQIVMAVWCTSFIFVVVFVESGLEACC